MIASAVASPARLSIERSGELVRIVLDRPKGNILDLEMLTALRAAVASIAREPGRTKLLVFEGAGAHFSFGASVPEHLPEKAGTLIPAFHAFFRELEALGIPTAAVVRGQCLGGAFELALWCGMVFAEPSGRFGVPETKLGVFPPVAALALPWRVGGARATQLILTGEVVEAGAALALGLVDAVGDDAEAALSRWFDAHLADKSAVALRAAWRASRLRLAAALANSLPVLEAQYLRDLMKHHDPVEGLNAFLERRPPVWKHD
jgi:cyclohexa-1,5-dienecarbonyl-CoA hydratase